MANKQPDGPEDNAIQGAESEPASPHPQAGRGHFDARLKRSGSGANKKLFLLAALIVLVAVAGFVGLWAFVIHSMTMTGSPVDEKAVKADPTLQPTSPNDDAMLQAKQEVLERQRQEKERADREAELEKAQKAADESKGKPSPPGRGTPPPSGETDGQSPHLAAEQRKLGSRLMLARNQWSNQESGGQEQASNPPGRLPEDLGTADPSPLVGSASRGSLANLSGTNFAPTKATFGPARQYLLAHGTYLRCALYTEVVTNHPGLVDCRLTDPLYSADGSTVLAEAGDTLSGEQSVELRPGQAEVFTSWTELNTQRGVRVRLDSLGAGPMGASGTQGWIDNHYKERFGGAILLSLMQDALKSASNLTQRSSGSGGYTINNSEQNVESMASRALENSINIPPTGHLSPGTVLTVIVARDVDFSTVYQNRR